MTTETPYHNNHTRFGGRIYESDFNTDYKPANYFGDIINRILSDMRFDRHCALNIKDRNRKKEIKCKSKN